MIDDIIDFFTSDKTKKESISQDLNNLSENSIKETFSKENLEKTENQKKLFSNDEEVKKKVKEEFTENLKARLNKDNQRYIKDGKYNEYCNEVLKQKGHEFEEFWQKEIDKKEKEEREKEIRDLNDQVYR